MYPDYINVTDKHTQIIDIIKIYNSLYPKAHVAN